MLSPSPETCTLLRVMRAIALPLCASKVYITFGGRTIDKALNLSVAVVAVVAVVVIAATAAAMEACWRRSLSHEGGGAGCGGGGGNGGGGAASRYTPTARARNDSAQPANS